MKELEFKLDYCDKCMQMTNHLGDECQKCKAKEKKLVDMKNTKTKKTKKKNIKSACSEAKCPMCGAKTFGWVYMLHFTLGCEIAKRY